MRMSDVNLPKNMLTLSTCQRRAHQPFRGRKYCICAPSIVHSGGEVKTPGLATNLRAVERRLPRVGRTRNCLALSSFPTWGKLSSTISETCFITLTNNALHIIIALINPFGCRGFRFSEGLTGCGTGTGGQKVAPP